jgi:molybdenum cofactor biosynthesis enzyme MoaA
VTDFGQTRLKRTFADVLNSNLSTSPLRIEIVSAETTATSGLANLTELADTVRSELRVIEQMPVEQLPHESTWEHGGLRLVWRARQRTPDEADAPVVAEPSG